MLNKFGHAMASRMANNRRDINVQDAKGENEKTVISLYNNFSIIY